MRKEEIRQKNAISIHDLTFITARFQGSQKYDDMLFVNRISRSLAARRTGLSR